MRTTALVSKADCPSGAEFRIGGARAFYNTVGDFVQVPPPQAYFEPTNWHRTAFHELSHFLEAIGVRSGSETRRSGWEFVRVCIDDASRIAFVQPMPNQRKESAVAFLEAAVAYYASLGLTIERVMRSSPKSRAEFGHSLLPYRRLQHGLVDDEARLASVLNIEHRAHVGGADAGEALIRPAQRVRREDNVVEFQQRVASRAALAPGHPARRRRCGDLPALW